METMNISERRTILDPAMVFQSLVSSGWTLAKTRRSISTGGSYEVWTHTNENGSGYATIPCGVDYIPRFAEEALTSIAKHYGLTQEYVYEKLMKGEKI